MNYFKVTFSNRDHLITGFNGDIETAKRYYIGHWFNLGVETDLMVKGVNVEVA